MSMSRVKGSASRGKQEQGKRIAGIEHEYEHEQELTARAPRYQLSGSRKSRIQSPKGSASRSGASSVQNRSLFFKIVKAKFIATREIVIEFVF
jgi:hypothetical protein